MPRPPRPLPAHLSGRSFSVATGTQAGVSDRRMRATDLAAPFHAIRTPAGPLTMKDRCAARMSRLPAHAAVSHTSAARLDSIPLPRRLADDDTVHVSVPVGARAPQGRSTRGHQVIQRSSEADRRHGMLCTSAARTFCDLASMLSLAELVAAGDFILRAGLATADELADTIEHHAMRRGRARLLHARALLDARSESPKESELRVLILDHGHPAPEVQHRVRDSRGAFVARVDLAYPELKIAIEYEGDHHRDRARWQRDLARRRRLEALGWIYLTVTQTDLDDPTAFLADLSAVRATR